MIEVQLLDYLKEVMEIPVYMEEPEVSDPPFLIIQKTGGGQNNYINSATFAIQSYGKSLYDTAKLNSQLKKVMEEITIKTGWASDCSLNSDYNFTDTTKKRYRYQAVFNLIYI